MRPVHERVGGNAGGNPECVAQTNIQLYRQLTESGWNASDLAGIQDAYNLAARRFSRQFRPSGKPFLCHLVGTASLVAFAGAAPVVVQAALLHAWRTHRGPRVFGHRLPLPGLPWPRGISPSVRRLVVEYELLHRALRHRPSVPKSENGLNPDALVIHIANEIERYVDHGGLFVDRYREDRDHARWIADLATRYGLINLSPYLQAMLHRDSGFQLPDGFQLTSPRA